MRNIHYDDDVIIFLSQRVSENIAKTIETRNNKYKFALSENVIKIGWAKLLQFGDIFGRTQVLKFKEMSQMSERKFYKTFHAQTIFPFTLS